MRLTIRVTLILVCCLFAANAQAQYVNTKLSEKKITIRSAAILPAKVEITKESAKGSEMMVAESADISQKVMQAVDQALTEKKISVAKNTFEPAALDETRKYTLADILSRYDALLP